MGVMGSGIVVSVVTGGKQSQLLASALGLGCSLTKIMKYRNTESYAANNIVSQDRKAH